MSVIQARSYCRLAVYDCQDAMIPDRTSGMNQEDKDDSREHASQLRLAASMCHDVPNGIIS